MTALVDRLRALPPAHQRAVIEAVRKQVGPEAWGSIAYSWQEFWARPEQRFPDPNDPRTIVIWTGEFGSGKTQAAVEFFNYLVLTGQVKAPRVVGATREAVRTIVFGGDAERKGRDASGKWSTTTVKANTGSSGICQWLPPWKRPVWRYAEEDFVYPNGTLVGCFSADAPGGIAGGNPDLTFCDDIEKWVDAVGAPRAKLAWSKVLASTRKGRAWVLVATTPGGAAFVSELCREEGALEDVRIVHLGAPENNKGNLSPEFLRRVRALRERGEWAGSDRGPFRGIELASLRGMPPARLREICVWIDPAATAHPGSCEVGVVGAGVDDRGVVWILRDVSAVAGPEVWVGKALDLLDELRAAYPNAPSFLGVETNTGGLMAPELVRQEVKLRAASAGRPPTCSLDLREVLVPRGEGKGVRAEPIAALARAGQLRLALGLAELEGSLKQLGGEGRFDRADAAVHAARALARIADRERPGPDPADVADRVAAVAAANRRAPASPFTGRV